MWSFLRRQANYFFIGFIITFVAYLFVRFDNDEVLLGVVISLVGGFAVSALILFLERRFPERGPGTAGRD